MIENKSKILTLCGVALLPLPGVASFAKASPTQQTADKPNVVLIMTDQQRADLCGREGYPLDVTPFVDKMANEGVWFNKAYTTAPASVPARTSFLTGRYPKATRVTSNHNETDVVADANMFGTARENGYRTAMVGKNHSFLRPDSADYWSAYGHGGGRPAEKGVFSKEFNQYLGTTSIYADMEPCPLPMELQQPYRMVDDALGWVQDDSDTRPFLLWLSFPEPHNPYQASEPYYSMFPPETLPKLIADESMLSTKGARYEHLKEIMEMGHVGYSENLDRLRSIYLGMVRLIDDQLARFVDELQQSGHYENTVFVVLSDHGDYVGEYGLMKKGVGLPDVLSRIPMVWFGEGIKKHGLSDGHVSIADIYPTICQMMGAEIPMGVQGRSLKNMLAGNSYPKDEFRSVMIEDGYGGQYYTKEDGTDYIEEGLLHKNPYFFDELNTWTQSGSRRALRMGDWKLEYDMTGVGEMYNMKADPSEVENLYGNPRYADKQSELLAELLKWEIATEDPLPIPRKRYRFKRYENNYMFYEK